MPSMRLPTSGPTTALELSASLAESLASRTQNGCACWPRQQGSPHDLLDRAPDRRRRPRLLAVDNAAFFFDPNAVPGDVVTSHLDWSRTFGAGREGSDELAGVYTSYEMAVTAPGPLDTVTQLPMAGLSWVSVHPDHRRRGVLRQMITHHFAQVHEQGVALSGLHAAEVGIYGRFGYGVSSLELELELERGAVFTAPSLEDSASRVTTHFVKADSDATAELVHDLHLSCAEDALGAVTRPERLARPQFVDLPLTRQGREPWQVLVAHVDDRPAGYAVFSRQSKWTDFRAKGTVTVREVAAADPAVMLALARRLVDFDLTASITINGCSADDPLVWWAGGPRALGVTPVDSLWLRLIDVGAALTARGYSSGCDVVLDVVDPVCPWNQGSWRLTVGVDGVATCLPTSDDADVRLPVQSLGAAYLGSRSLATQTHQGLVAELTPGSVRILSRAMSCDREPVGAIEF
jgi:predicted acetyltransferase